MGGKNSREKLYYPEGLTRRFGYVSQFHDTAPEEAPRATGPISGAYKILSIGINYSGTKHQLGSAVTDTHNHLRFLKRRGFVPSCGFRCLTDDGRGDMMPTFENIVRSLMWLVEGAQPGHAMYLHFSGHGTILNGTDSYLVPMDFKTRGAIHSDVIAEVLGKTPPGARVVAVIDTSYACTIVPLPWQVMLGNSEFRWLQERHARDLLCGQIVVITGARPDQDEQVCGTGALSIAVMSILDSDPNVTFEHLLRRLREGLRSRLGNRCKLPCIASSHKFDLHERFSLGMNDKDRMLLSSYRMSTRVGESTATHANFFIGAKVDGWFYDAWYPAVVRTVNGDGTFNLDWEDGTTTMGVDASGVRLPFQVGSDVRTHDNQPAPGTAGTAGGAEGAEGPPASAAAQGDPDMPHTAPPPLSHPPPHGSAARPHTQGAPGARPYGTQDQARAATNNPPLPHPPPRPATGAPLRETDGSPRTPSVSPR